MKPDIWLLYRHMLRSRRFEEAVMELWQAGKISAEMHLGVGEEAIAAGIVAQLVDGDALALDHRGTPPLVVRGVDLASLLREFLGCSDGLCAGMGGHMHLFSPEHLAASSGIVGAAAPAGIGFALAAQHLRPGNVAVAFFGEGAMNQGMVMESLNLAVVWNLPVIFVCKDNNLSITTRSTSVTGGQLSDRARSFRLAVSEIDGVDVEAVWDASAQALERARDGDGPSFILARCSHLEGHFLGDPVMRIIRSPVKEFKPYLRPMLRSTAATAGGSVGERVASLGAVTGLFRQVMSGQFGKRHDPVERLRRKLSNDKPRLEQIDQEVASEIQSVVESALASLS